MGEPMATLSEENGEREIEVCCDVAIKLEKEGISDQDVFNKLAS